jgi:hypothetical protein
MYSDYYESQNIIKIFYLIYKEKHILLEKIEKKIGE